MSLGSMDNPNAITNMLNFLGEQEQDLNARFTKEVIELHALIKYNLGAALGEKAKYFDVNIQSGASGLEISVYASDIKGTFLYRGTSAHDIISTYDPMPMPDGGFARSVRHPGTESMKQEIDQAIMAAVRASRLF